jgi:membrane associated rhomboid family serine protease
MSDAARPLPPPNPPLPRPLVALVLLMAGIELVLTLADRGILADPTLRARVYAAGAFWAGLLDGGRPLFPLQPYTMFVTHALLHGGLLHLALNMAVLLGLGRFAADRYGPGVILPVFLVTAVAGGLAFGLISEGAYPMVGASGAVFGFLGVWIASDWVRLRTLGLSVQPVVRRVAGLAVANVLLTVLLAGMLAWEAHLGGFLAGLVAGVWLERGLALEARAARAAARQRRGSGNQ